jgi:hypothetical protein
MVTFVALGIPLLITHGLRGLAIGISLQTFANVCVRIYYMRQIFENFDFVTHAARSMFPALPAIGFVVAARALERGPRTFWMAAGEVAIYVSITAALTWLTERNLLREAIGYIRARRLAPAAA